MEYIFHTDAGHGWLEVDKTLIDKMGLSSRVSSYSYTKLGKVYLEEDCDAGLFIEALKNRGIEFKYRTLHTDNDSIIRTYKRY